MKGASAHFINYEICNRKILEWQTGHGMVTFGTNDLPWAIKYAQIKESIMRAKLFRIAGSASNEWNRDKKPVESG